MALEDKALEQTTVADKSAFPTVSYAMTVRDYVVRPTATSAITITLPPVAEAVGKFYSIIARSITDTTITITSAGDSESWEGDLVLYEAGQGQLFYSDGMKWMGRTMGDLEVEASPRAAYFKSRTTDAEATAIRGRGEAAGASASAIGVHAQGIAYTGVAQATVNALYAEAIAKDTSAVTTLRGAMIVADSEGTPTSIGTMYGAHIRVKSSVQPATAYNALHIENQKFGTGTYLGAFIRITDVTFVAGETVATNGVLIQATGDITYGFHVASLTTAAVKISNVWGTGYNTGGILIAADSAGTALALGATTAGIQGIYINTTAIVTGGENYQGIYSRFSTAGAMVDGFIINGYFRTRLQHVGFENYSLWGRMDVNVAQTGDSGNMYLGVFGTTAFAAGAHALTATGGGAGVYGVASIASGGTLDQWLIGVYAECNAVDSIAGLTTASRHRMLGYCDYGVDVLVQTSNGLSAMRIQTTDSAVVDDGITFTSTTGTINRAFNFTDADESDGASVAAGSITDADDYEGLIKIDAGGTNYYIPFYEASVVGDNWADV